MAIDQSYALAWRRIAVVVLLLIVFVTPNAHGKKNRSTPHPHQGVLKAYEPGPFTNIKLTSADEKKLADGQPVMKQTMADESDPMAGGGAICVQDVAAPKATVWEQILDMDSYKGKVPKVISCNNYFTGKTDKGNLRFKTKMVVGVLPGYAYESYYDHVYFKDDNSMTWKLDYEKTSDFDDVSGHWHVEDHPTRPGNCRVFYACDIKLKGSVPGPVLNYISKAALKQATGWVKKESEKNAPEDVPTSDDEVVERPAKRSRFAFGRQ